MRIDENLSFKKLESSFFDLMLKKNIYVDVITDATVFLPLLSILVEMNTHIRVYFFL